MAGGPFQGEAGAAAPGPIQQPPMAAPAAQANAAAGSGVEPMMEDALNDLLVFPDISVLWFLLDLKHSYNIAKYIYHIIRSFFVFYQCVYIA